MLDAMPYVIPVVLLVPFAVTLGALLYPVCQITFRRTKGGLHGIPWICLSFYFQYWYWKITYRPFAIGDAVRPCSVNLHTRGRRDLDAGTSAQLETRGLLPPSIDSSGRACNCHGLPVFAATDSAP